MESSKRKSYTNKDSLYKPETSEHAITVFAKLYLITLEFHYSSVVIKSCSFIKAKRTCHAISKLKDNQSFRNHQIKTLKQRISADNSLGEVKILQGEAKPATKLKETVIQPEWKSDEEKKMSKVTTLVKFLNKAGHAHYPFSCHIKLNTCFPKQT